MVKVDSKLKAKSSKESNDYPWRRSFGCGLLSRRWLEWQTVSGGEVLGDRSGGFLLRFVRGLNYFLQ